ncbi:MAG: PD40 domain-containing protein [Candidatus Latescibacteria bacterium]|nr:PD40 domain-containing protein [Candidatus Latescibacterota bacterium]
MAMFCLALVAGAQAQQPAAPAAAPADTQGLPSVVHLSIKGSGRLLPLAMLDFTREGGDAELEQRTKMVGTFLGDDLRNCGRFEVLRDSLQVDSTGFGPVLDRWSSAGARALLRGAMRQREGRTELFATLYRLPDQRVLIAKGYPVDQGQALEAAHRLSNDIVYALTGQQGIAFTQIAFVSKRQGDKEIYRMGYDGYDPRPVTNDRAINYSPDWSPDGRQIVYSSMRNNGWQLFIADLVAGVKTPIRTPSSSNTAPTWSPDGRRVLFAMSGEVSTDLYTVTVPGWQLQRLTDHPEADSEPAWSPDGRQVAFTSDRAGLQQVYLMNADGSDVRRLTWEPDACEGSPAWSPDGKRLAFVRRGFDGFDVHVMELEGGSPVRLTSGGSNEAPAWSPDGLQLAFSSNRTGNSEIYAMGWDGSNLRRLTYGGENEMPAWSPISVGNR